MNFLISLLFAIMVGGLVCAAVVGGRGPAYIADIFPARERTPGSQGGRSRMNPARIILRMAGWSVHCSVPDYPKCIICVAPHTSPAGHGNTADCAPQASQRPEEPRLLHQETCFAANGGIHAANAHSLGRQECQYRLCGAGSFQPAGENRPCAFGGYGQCKAPALAETFGEQCYE